MPYINEIVTFKVIITNFYLESGYGVYDNHVCEYSTCQYIEDLLNNVQNEIQTEEEL